MKRFTWLLCVLVPAAAAQPITPFYLYELQPTLAELSSQPSSTDLVQGFPETTTPGILADQVINESFYNGMAGVIDPVNEVYSWLMNPFTPCLPMNVGQASDGFLPGYGGNPGQFVDGLLNGPTDGILRDYGRAALAVRFGFSTPRDIGVIRVIGGNFLNRDERTFHHYDVWASTDGAGDAGTFFPLALGVRTGYFSLINTDLWAGSLTEVHDFDSPYLVQGCTDLRLVFYCVGNTQRRIQDPWQGNFNEDPGYQAQCPEAEPQDTDGFRKAFVGSIIREIDVFPPGPENPWGDIDYDRDHDLRDAAAFQRCYFASTTAGGCFRFDFDQDTLVAFNDFQTFAGMLAGPN